MRRWERARSGQGQFVQIVGEPGIGKSRLDRGVPRAPRRDAAHLGRMVSSSQLLQNTPLHPIAEWGRQRFGDADDARGPAFRRPREHIAADRPRSRRTCAALAPLVDIPLPADRARQSRARGAPAKAARGADRLVSGRGAFAARRARLRGPALGRSDLARSHAGARRARRAGAAAHPRDHAARVPTALEPALAPQRHFAQPPRSRRRRAHGRRARRAPCAAPRGGRGRERAHRRRAAVRRGGHAPLFERGVEGGAQAIPPTLAAVARGAARPARRSARGRADRRGARARFFLRALARCRPGSTTRPCNPRSIGSPRPTSSSSRARRPGRPIASSTR